MAGGGNGEVFDADFFGEHGNDTLRGSGLGQTLDGGDGDDIIEGLGGSDAIVGGQGFDTALYSSAPGAVNMIFNFGDTPDNSAQFQTVEDGYGSTDDLSGIETVIASDFDDVFQI